MAHDLFISYGSQDRERVLEIVDQLETSGVQVWVDRRQILGGMNFGTEIARAVKDCKVLVVICSNASMRSRNVKAEIQLAWNYEKPILPLMLEPTSFPEQLEYWLLGWQWIEVMDLPAEHWLPPLVQALSHAGVPCSGIQAVPGPGQMVRPTRPDHGLKGLLSIARLTDQIWPVPAGRVQRDGTRSATRDLGAPQDDVQHGYPLGSRVCLAIESDHTGHLLLLDEGTSGKVYCLCPSWFAPDTRLSSGRTYLPQQGSAYDSFVVTGRPGRENLLAIVTEEPLGLDWMPADRKVPARVLVPADVEELLARLRGLEGNRWIALSTYFDVLEQAAT